MQRVKKFDPKPEVARGQAIFWHRCQGAVQGVTELTECVRTQDLWLLEVQNEMRAGQLSEDNCNFLHGRETTVPGSWVGGACGCGKEIAELLGILRGRNARSAKATGNPSIES
jgi:hypothetical protein